MSYLLCFYLQFYSIHRSNLLQKYLSLELIFLSAFDLIIIVLLLQLDIIVILILTSIFLFAFICHFFIIIFVLALWIRANSTCSLVQEFLGLADLFLDKNILFWGGYLEILPAGTIFWGLSWVFIGYLFKSSYFEYTSLYF